MLAKEKILAIAEIKGEIFTKDITAAFGVSRQYANSMIKELVAERQLIKFGSTRKSSYMLPSYAAKHPELVSDWHVKTFKNNHLEEHVILNEIEQKLPQLNRLQDNVHSIFSYAFSEMLNNAIEHSQSPTINIETQLRNNVLSFTISDSGLGVFRSVMQKTHLQTELEAIQDILKGKTTTMPRSHSGECIFFTSRTADQFILDSYGYQLIVDNELPDVFVQEVKKIKRGTRVSFKINVQSIRHLNDVFNRYANLDDNSNYGFDKTEILVKLYTIDGVYVSRSQARRILAGLDKFKVILLDYAKVPMVGQAFADEIYRVFRKKYPQIRIEEINMSETVKFMVERAKTEAQRQ